MLSVLFKGVGQKAQIFALGDFFLPGMTTSCFKNVGRHHPQIENY
jgi:hypothetical protein